MGDTSEGKDGGSASNSGVAQFQSDEGMEMELSINTSECKVGQASALGPSLGSNKESMVVLSN